MRTLFTVTLIGLLVAVVMAQGERRNSTQNPSGGNLNSAEITGRDETVKNQPYTAAAVIETTQTLADGNRIIQKVEQLVARDSQGRTRREQLLDRIGSLAADAPKLVFISDPVTGQDYTLNTRDKTVTVEKRIDIEALMKSAKERPSPQPRRDVKSENLGEKVLEGLTVKGERLSATMAAGAVGNERPLELSLETWYSPELHIFLYRKRVDPRFGEITYTVTNIRRTEPDSSLFKIPAGYRRL